MNIPYRLANGVGNPPDARKWMADYDWLTALLIGNLTKNGGFENWVINTSFANPGDATLITPEWTLRKSGTSACDCTVAREATIFDTGTYAMKFTINTAGSSNSLVGVDQSFTDSLRVKSQTFVTVWRVRASTASKVRLKIYDGTTTAYSDYHSGGGTFETLQAVLTAGASATTITVSIEITSDYTGSVYADGATLWLIPSGMTSTARAFLLYSALYNNRDAADISYGAGAGPVVTSPDGLTTWRLGVDNNGNITSTQLT